MIGFPTLWVCLAKCKCYCLPDCWERTASLANTSVSVSVSDEDALFGSNRGAVLFRQLPLPVYLKFPIVCVLFVLYYVLLCIVLYCVVLSHHIQPTMLLTAMQATLQRTLPFYQRPVTYCGSFVVALYRSSIAFEMVRFQCVCLCSATRSLVLLLLRCELLEAKLLVFRGGNNSCCFASPHFRQTTVAQLLSHLWAAMLLAMVQTAPTFELLTDSFQCHCCRRPTAVLSAH